jgi:hypothetical protein
MGTDIEPDGKGSHRWQEYWNTSELTAGQARYPAWRFGAAFGADELNRWLTRRSRSVTRCGVRRQSSNHSEHRLLSQARLP